MNLPQKMWLGSFETTFSSKYRVLLPKIFRKELGGEDKFYLVKGLDGEIWGFNGEGWQKEADIILKTPLKQREGRVLRRKFFSQAEECIMDGQGRFSLSKELMEYAGIKGGVLIIGAGDHFEIWDPQKFKEQGKRE